MSGFPATVMMVTAEKMSLREEGSTPVYYVQSGS